MVQKTRRTQAGHRYRSARFKLALVGIFAAAAGGGMLLYEWMGAPAPSRWPAAQTAAGPLQQPVQQPEALEFRMVDPDRGWIRFTDGLKATADGGATWQEADRVPEPADAEQARALAGLEEEAAELSRSLTALQYASRQYEVKQAQFLSPGIGWALVRDPDRGELGGSLLITVDGGASWDPGLPEKARAALEQHKKLLLLMQQEAALYEDEEAARLALTSDWLLMPSTASPGDAVLLRSRKPGQVDWQGRSYKLQPFGAGYFTYLPVPMAVKPGEYPIGGGPVLRVQAKTFPKQYLQVTEQMNSMRQETARIQADQEKINRARSSSQPAFLFTGPFLTPVKGELTTPYGHTRYVNGEFSGAHMAIDLAAPEGTPVHAANDGIVVLAESLYLTGNSIYIDHGMGLYSQYAHLSELQVKTGDHVGRGEVIGLVGTTGFSTGPHLHFTFWANGLQANPDRFFDTTPFYWLSRAREK